MRNAERLYDLRGALETANAPGHTDLTKEWALAEPLCTAPAVGAQVTTDHSKVTCKGCLRSRGFTGVRLSNFKAKADGCTL